MGKSACLVPSFFNPTNTSCVPQEECPIGVLGESISFGRFMLESLAWEKWSTFSHNRYVEEAKKFTKPGSVAEKKAYLEAHFKKKFAEKEAALVQEANASANGTFDCKTQEGNCTHSSTQMKSEADASANGTLDCKTQQGNCSDTSTEMKLEADSNVTANDHLDKDAVNYQVFNYAHTNKYQCDVEQSDLDISNVEAAEDVPQPCVDTNLNVKSSILVDNSNQFGDAEAHENNSIAKKERKPDPGTSGQKVLPSPVKGRELHSFPKLSTRTRAAKLSYSLAERKAAAVVQPRNGINSAPKGKKSVGDSDELKRLTAQSLHMSINLPWCPGETSKTTAAGLQPRNGINSASNGTKPVGDSVDKRPTARSLRMSINPPSGAGETSKTASVFEQNRIKKNHSNLPIESKDHLVASRTTTKASNGLLNLAAAEPQSEGRRTKWLFNKSLSGGVAANAKLPPTSVDCLKPSSITKRNPWSPTISSPFRFRSEERAEKRKEFFPGMDDTKSYEAEKVQQQRRLKEKTKYDQKKLQQSNGSKPKRNEDRNGGSQSPNNQMRETSLIQPQSPKLGRKASSSKVQDKSFGNSRKPPISTTNTKHVTGKKNLTREHVTSLSSIKRRSISNIQH